MNRARGRTKGDKRRARALQTEKAVRDVRDALKTEGNVARAVQKSPQVAWDTLLDALDEGEREEVARRYIIEDETHTGTARRAMLARWDTGDRDGAMRAAHAVERAKPARLEIGIADGDKRKAIAIAIGTWPERERELRNDETLRGWREGAPEQTLAALEGIPSRERRQIIAGIKDAKERKALSEALKAYRDEENERTLTELFGRARRGERVVRIALATGIGGKTWRARGLPESTVAAIVDERKQAMRVTAAAKAIGIPRGRLDRWQREGLVGCTYTATMKISGAGTVEGRLWTPIDIKAIKGKLEWLEAIDAENRAKKRAASARIRAQHGPSPQSVRRREREAEGEQRRRAEAARAGRAKRADLFAEAQDAATRDDIARTDMRHIPFVAIDPEDARDRDDAVWCARDGTGWTLLVAIADVGARVAPGTALDDAIREKGQSVYLPGGHRPMCPPVLSEHACSLHEGEDKLALVTTLHVGEDGHRETIEAMTPARVRITRAVSYGAARAEIEAQGDGAPGALGACAKALRAHRSAANAIILESPSDIEIEFDEGQRPIRSRYRAVHDAHRAIEEAMIAANVANARWLHTEGAQGAVFRCHEPPDWDEVAFAIEVALRRGAKLPAEADLHTALAHLPRTQGKPPAGLDDLVRKILPKAVYRTRSPWPHFALAEDVYAHTTSPIRRYADLRCQQWAHALRGHRAGPEPDPGLEEHLNDVERATVAAERGAIKRALATIALREQHRDWHRGRIASVLSWGVFAESDRIPGAQGLCHASAMRERSALDEYIDMRDWWDEGEQVQIRVCRADPHSGEIDVLLRR